MGLTSSSSSSVLCLGVPCSGPRASGVLCLELGRAGVSGQESAELVLSEMGMVVGLVKPGTINWSSSQEVPGLARLVGETSSSGCARALKGISAHQDSNLL
jgi:hypothetical protein